MARLEGIISALFFLTAFIFLMFNRMGILTIPGLIIAIAGIYLSLKSRYIYSAFLGILTGLGSFFAQYITAFCPFCTISATAFLLGGLLSMVFLRSENMKLNLGLLSLSAMAAVLLLLNLPHYEQQPIVAQPVAVSGSQGALETVTTDKAILYISPECKSCKTVIDQFIKFDTQGIYWQPVIIPAALLSQGEAMLKEKGYTGEVKSAFNSPTRFVPLLEIDEQYYRRDELTVDKIKIRKEAGS
jgi:hypothetical protein